MKLCSAKPVAVQAQFLMPCGRRVVPKLLRAVAIVCVALGTLAALALPSKPKPAPGPPGAGLPAALAAARGRSALGQLGSQPFHMEVQFESTSDTTAVSRGTFAEDWWNDQWSRQVTVVNGLKREVVQVDGKLYRDEDDDFVLPLRVQDLLLALLWPFPEGAQQQASESTLQLAHSPLHCFTLPTGTETADLKAAPKTFCVDEAGDLRMTADPNHRIVYTDVVAAGSHQVPRTMMMFAGREMVASLHVTRCTLLRSEPSELRAMSMEEQIRFALANPRMTMMLQPVLMQRQLLSTDVRMMPRGGTVLQPGQKFALMRVVESNGRLLDAEVVGASDDASRALALRILRMASFRIPPRQGSPVAFEGTLLLSPP